jgi:hypothetical protein
MRTITNNQKDNSGYASDNDFAHECERSPWFQAGLLKAMPNIKKIILENRKVEQRSGIDATLIYADNTYHTIDFKFRKRSAVEEPVDFLFETISNMTKGTPGWAMEENNTDLIAYVFVYSRSIFIFDAKEIAEILKKKLEYWKLLATQESPKERKGFGIKLGRTQGAWTEYSSENIMVPMKEVKKLGMIYFSHAWPVGHNENWQDNPTGIELILPEVTEIN